MVVLVCLIPKSENDLFFILRIGGDIVKSHGLPHADTYSWINRGTPWDLPEWLAFILYALAFRAGAFFGTWLLMTALTLAAILVIWLWVANRIGIVWGFVLTLLTLLATSDYIQERPYAFTYLLLPVSLALLLRAREDIECGRTGARKRLAAVAALAVLWANVHPGVVAFVGTLAVYACGDGLRAILAVTRSGERPRHIGRAAAPMAATAAACAAASTISPYGWHIYRTVAITVGNSQMMSNVTEWRSITVLPIAQMDAFLVLAAVTAAVLCASRRPDRIPDALALGALLVESILHARNIPLFAIGAAMIGAHHAAGVLGRWQPDLLPEGRMSSPPRFGKAGTAAVAVVGVLTILSMALVTAAKLAPAIGRKGYSAEGIGEAVARVPSYPDDACAFVDREHFPPNLRIFNNFALGGYLMWRLPSEPVFVDGRLDVYAGRTFDNMLILARPQTSPGWGQVARAYDFDCVITSTNAVVVAFARDPEWQIVYEPVKRAGHSDCRILLRRRPRFRALIARCLQNRQVAKRPP